MIAMLNRRNGFSKRMALAVLALIIFNYVILNKLHPGGVMAYVLPTTCWGFLALVALKACGFKRIKSWFNSHVSIAAASVAIFYIIILVNIGLFMGFGVSALSFTPRGLIINLALVLTTLLGMEFSRAYLVKSFGKRKPFLTIGLVTLLYSFIGISVFRLLALNDPLGLVKFMGVGLLPVIAENLLATYLALVGGPVASLAYRGPIMAFWWFCPILPHLSWGVEALLGVMVPTVGFFVVNQFTSPMTLRRSGIPTEVKGFGARREGSSLRSWIFVSIACVLMVWTTTGLLGIQPTAVLSGSMKPTMDVGDMAIVRDVPTDSIEVGDIIQYWRDGEMVIHRVVEVSNGGNEKLFVTQGDANSVPDTEPVLPNQVTGKVVLTIPELGWVPIGVKAFAVGVWSFVSANPMVIMLIIGLGGCVVYLYWTRSSRSWRAPKWKKRVRVGGRIVPLIALLLVGTAASGLAYSHWSESLYISGTVTTGLWEKSENIPPIDDSFVFNRLPCCNFGRWPVIKAFDMKKCCMTWTAYGFLKFDLSGLPEDASITSAELHMYGAGVHLCTCEPARVGVKFVENDSWDEHTITWWNMPNPDYELDNRYVGRPGWYGWDVTSAAEHEFDGDKVLSLTIRTGWRDFSIFCSKETWECCGCRPYLKLTYTSVDPPGDPLEISGGNPSGVRDKSCEDLILGILENYKQPDMQVGQFKEIMASLENRMT